MLRYDCFYILHFDFRFGQEVKVKLGSPFCKYCWQLTICTMVQKLWIYLLWLLRYDFFNIKLWLPVWTRSKGQLGVTFCKYFLTINDLYNGTKIVNLPVVVVEIWFFKISKFDFRFGQEVKVKLGSPFKKYFLTITDLYNFTKIVNLPVVVVEIWFFKIFKILLPVWTGSKGQIEVTFL